MRHELKEVVNLKSNPKKVYGLSRDSIIHFLKATKSILETREKERQEYIKSHSVNGIYDVVCDPLYYHNIDDQYLYQFVFIKCLGILEQKVDEKLSKRDIHKPLIEKISLLDNTINTVDLDEWIKLRNELTHRPFEPYYSVRIIWEDVEEFSKVILNMMNKLKFH